MEKRILSFLSKGSSLRSGFLAVFTPFIIVTALISLTIVSNKWQEWYLTLSIQSTVTGIVQVFFDVGRDFNAEDSVIGHIAKADTFFNFTFTLPDEPIKLIRIDPLNREGQFRLKNLAIINGLNQTVQRIELDSIKPLQQVCEISRDNDVYLADTVVGANDPIISLDLNYPLVRAHNFYRLGVYVLTAFICASVLWYLIMLGWVYTVPKIKLASRPSFLTKNALLTLTTFVISLGVSGFVGFGMYTIFMKPEKSVVYQGQNGEYALSFFTSDGQRISDREGDLKQKLDPFTLYANYPNQKSASYTIDPDGFRQTYSGESVSDRLAFVMGGSAAFGQGLFADNDTFASQLGHLNPDYRFINAGTVGYLSGQELAQMIHVLDRFKPSLYIVFDGWNDVFIPFSYVRKWPVKEGPIGFNDVFLLIEQRLVDALKEKRKAQGSKNSDWTLPVTTKTSYREAGYYQEVRSTYIANISRMNAFAKARQADFLLVIQPELTNKKILSPIEQSSLEQWNKIYNYLDKGFPEKYKKLIEVTRAFCQENDIAYLDLNQEATFCEDPETLFYDVVHPNEAGHKKIAELINTVLLEKF
ncbi:SGNH/GDSL hydrolase family protein [bacterium]|nr:SGNH/GDSL hydrolase family protein [bacterium]